MKTMVDKSIHTPCNYKHDHTFFNKSLDTARFYNPIKILFYKTLGTIIIYRPMFPTSRNKTHWLFVPIYPPKRVLVCGFRGKNINSHKMDIEYVPLCNTFYIKKTRKICSVCEKMASDI